MFDSLRIGNRTTIHYDSAQSQLALKVDFEAYHGGGLKSPLFLSGTFNGKAFQTTFDIRSNGIPTERFFGVRDVSFYEHNDHVHLRIRNMYVDITSFLHTFDPKAFEKLQIVPIKGNEYGEVLTSFVDEKGQYYVLMTRNTEVIDMVSLPQKQIVASLQYGQHGSASHWKIRDDRDAVHNSTYGSIAFDEKERWTLPMLERWIRLRNNALRGTFGRNLATKSLLAGNTSNKD